MLRRSCACWGEGNAGPKSKDLDGTPILLVAATIGHAEIVSVLITAGANPDARLPSACVGVDDGDSFRTAAFDRAEQFRVDAVLHLGDGVECSAAFCRRGESGRRVLRLERRRRPRRLLAQGPAR